MSKEKCSCLIFDLDGTIADTIGSIRDAINIALSDEGYPKRSYEEVRVAIGNGAKMLIKRSLPQEVRDDPEIFEKVFAAYEEAYEDTYLNLDSCYDGVYDTICALKKKGYAVAILSNKQDVFVKGIAEKLFPSGIIDIAMGQTDMPIKPDPTAPVFILEKLGASPEDSVFIGDSEVDIRTGKNAGMRTVAVSWGYRDRASLESEPPDFIIDRAEELIEILN